MKKAVAGAEREQREGASGKWVAHWKMVHLVRPVWADAGELNQMGRTFPALGYGPEDAAALTRLEPAPRTVRGARDLISVALQYGNAFLRGFQAAALKSADFFGDDDVLYLMEDMATGEIRLSVLWEWLHKGAVLSQDDPATGVRAGAAFSRDLCDRLLAEEFAKLQQARSKDVHDDSKATTLPIARAIVVAYLQSRVKPPWFVDLLNLTLGLEDLAVAEREIDRFLDGFERDGTRITGNPRFQG
jgi:malate synthase